MNRVYACVGRGRVCVRVVFVYGSAVGSSYCCLVCSLVASILISIVRGLRGWSDLVVVVVVVRFVSFERW